MATPQLSATWWTKNKGTFVTGKELTGTLQAYEKKKKTAQASESEKDWDDLDEILQDVVAAAEKTKRKCNQKLHKTTIKHLDDMIKMAELERKTANQMSRVACAEASFQALYLDLKATLKKLEGPAKAAKQIEKTLDPLHRALPGWLETKNKEKLSEALRTLTKMRNLAKPFPKVLIDTSATVQALDKLSGSPPKYASKTYSDCMTLHKQVHALRDLLQQAKDSTDDLVEWFEKQLMALRN